MIGIDIGFGCAGIGNLFEPYTPEESFGLLEEAWNQGIRYFDTAPEYGRGLSERRLGDFLRSKPKNDYILSTKVGELLTADWRTPPPENKFIDKLPFRLHFDYSYDAIMRGFEDSLQRLGLEKIDILLVHDLDPIIHPPEIFSQHFRTFLESGYSALHTLKTAHLIQGFGLAIKKWEVCAEASRFGDYDYFMLQGNYNLLEHQALENFLDSSPTKKWKILQAAPFASGILATGATESAFFNYRKAPKAIIDKVATIESICQEFSVPLRAAALQFPLFHPMVSSVVMGARTREQLRDNLQMRKFPIPQAFWQTLKEKNLIPAKAPT